MMRIKFSCRAMALPPLFGHAVLDHGRDGALVNIEFLEILEIRS